MEVIKMTVYLRALYRICIILFTFSLFSLEAYSIIFVHIGKSLPPHLSVSIAQARLFNKECPIYLISNQEAIDTIPEELDKCNVTCIACESLPASEIHQKFRECTHHDWEFRGLLVYSTERFFYLDEFIKERDLHDVFHLENDIMLYVNLDDLLPIFKKNYPGMIAATFENDTRCVPGFMYISDPQPLATLVQSFPTCMDQWNTDMFLIARFKNQYRKVLIDYLPTIPPEYTHDHVLRSKETECYYNHFEDFHSVFDASSFGIFLGGWDSTFHQESSPNAINYNSIIDLAYFSIEWKKDAEGRRIPYIEYKGKSLPINNLHISNKSQIRSFHSLN